MNPGIRTALLLLAVAMLAACVTRPEIQMRTYDFGLASARETPPPPIHVRQVESPDWLDRPDMLYRLAYRDPRALEPYALSRWAGTPASMLTLRLRQALGDSDPRTARCIMSVHLEEFSQIFDTESSSRAVLHARAGLREASGMRRSESTSLRLERPAPTPDAAGGAAAFAALADEMTSQLRDWIATLGYCQQQD
jgi:cholesterol transport system auxiliary component